MADSKSIELFRRIDCTTVTEFLEKLSPHTGEELWDRPDHEHWLFRGQVEATWPLEPKAMRLGELRRYLPKIGQAHETPAPLDMLESMELEERAVMEFCTIASQHGMDIPGDKPQLRDRGHRPNANTTGANFPSIDHHFMYALAQHYRVPTRLLDWSLRPLVAAYFPAIEESPRQAHPFAPPRTSSDGRLAVWAVSRLFIDEVLTFVTLGACTITVPTPSNPNVLAQAGVLTLVRTLVAEDKRAWPLPNLDQLIHSSKPGPEVFRAKELAAAPMLYQFTLPHDKARALLYMLSLHGITSASVYPGLDSAEKALLERSWYSRIRPGD